MHNQFGFKFGYYRPTKCSKCLFFIHIGLPPFVMSVVHNALCRSSTVSDRSRIELASDTHMHHAPYSIVNKIKIIT